MGVLHCIGVVGQTITDKHVHAHRESRAHPPDSVEKKIEYDFHKVQMSWTDGTQ